MPVAQIIAWVSAGQELYAAGAATIENIRGFIKSLHPDLSDADLNAICDAVIAGATRHKGLADADAMPPA